MSDAPFLANGRRLKRRLKVRTCYGETRSARNLTRDRLPVRAQAGAISLWEAVRARTKDQDSWAPDRQTAQSASLRDQGLEVFQVRPKLKLNSPQMSRNATYPGSSSTTRCSGAFGRALVRPQKNDRPVLARSNRSQRLCRAFRQRQPRRWLQDPRHQTGLRARSQPPADPTSRGS